MSRSRAVQPTCATIRPWRGEHRVDCMLERTAPKRKDAHGCRRAAALSLMSQTLRIGTRASRLAMVQAEEVSRLLRETSGVECELVPVTTAGDRNRGAPLSRSGGKGLFVSDIERKLVNGEIDLAVHSCKDMPSDNDPALALAAALARADARDVLVSRDYTGLEELPEGAMIGTSSVRRRAQLLAVRPDLDVVPLRGNVDTRVRRAAAGDFSAIILAAAGLARLGLDEKVATTALDPEMFLPAPGQGAIVVQVRAGDESVLPHVVQIDDPVSHLEIDAERAFAREIGGSCELPVAAHASVAADELTLSAMVVSLDGRQVVRDRVDGAARSGASLGRDLARRIKDAGGEAIIQEAARELE